RLYTAQDYHARPDHETAEIHRLDLAETTLELHAAGIADVRTFAWFEAPSESALEAAESLLSRLGAIDDRGQVTPAGWRMLRFPLHPRQSRVLIEAQDRGAGEKAAIIAALIGERDLVATSLFKGDSRVERRGAQTAGPSDLLDRLDLFENAARSNFSRFEGLDYGAVLSVEKVRKQLERLAGKSGAPAPLEELEQRLLISILAGYPDRVARRRSLKTDNVEVLLSNGGSAALSKASVVRQSEFLVAVDAEERREAGKIVRLASAIEPEWLIDLFPDQLRKTTEARWNAESERVEVVKRLLYDKLVIDESRTNEGNEAAEVLAEAALSAGLQKFVDPESVEKFIARIDFVAQTFPDAELPSIDDSDVREALITLCEGLNSFTQLRQAAGKGGLLEVLRQKLNPEQARLVDRMAPEQVAIAGRRQVRVNYEQGKPPWIASRLQDFFGMTEGPRIAGGRIPLVLHLLAPNQRPVQVTTDLAGFWLRTYPQVRRELSRRYPRHAWPENPK
ncbi:MAG: ATP-dependent helicase HrpB, partial [Blastocatellia bacterium]|nr:ATP-dependent helicase HrpB [Blastocatellia bacterium]